MSKEIRKNSGAIIRAIRYYCSLNQSQMLELLETSQPSLSKYENGILLPDAAQWVKFCDRYKLNPTCIFSGKIDVMEIPEDESPGNFHRSVRLRDVDKRIGDFKIPKKYSFLMGSTVRTAYPFIKLMRSALGEDFFQDFCDEKGMEPSYFVIMTNPLNLNFMNDLISVLIQKKVLNADDGFSKLYKTSSFHDIHSSLYDSGVLREDNHQENVLSHFTRKLNSSYEINSRYDYISAREVSVEDAKHVKEFNLSDDLLNFRKEYNLSHFKELAKKYGFKNMPKLKNQKDGWIVEFAS